MHEPRLVISYNSQILVMMTGEFDAKDYMTTHGAQTILFPIFVVFVSIVIANLLIGMTVSNIGYIFSTADSIRLNQIIEIMNAQTQNNSQKLFQHLKSVTQYKKTSNKPWKVCILPNSREEVRSKLNEINYNPIKRNFDWYCVYFYDEIYGKPQEKLDIFISANDVKKALEILKNRQETNDRFLQEKRQLEDPFFNKHQSMSMKRNKKSQLHFDYNEVDGKLEEIQNKNQFSFSP